MKILLSRTDNIGDVVLTFPMVGYLRKILPEVKIYYLGKNYTQEIISINEDVDEFVNYSNYASEADLINYFKEQKFDAIIHIFPNKLVASAAKKAKIPLRIGTLNRIFHWFTCNKKISFSRNKSDLHESQLNFELLRAFKPDLEIPAIKDLPNLIKLKISKFHPSEGVKKIIFHTKSFGSAVDWDLNNYIELAKKIDKSKYNIYFTGTQKESELITPYIQDLIKEGGVYDYTGKFTLAEYINFIASSDVLVACSTGPLHIAAILDVPVIGLYSSRRPIHSGRWSPIGKNANVLIADDSKLERASINIISIGEVFQKIQNLEIN